MPKPRRNRIRKERIRDEIIVDAYGPEEQALGWYYYLGTKVQFPFTARCIGSKVVSPLRKGETLEVRGLAPEDSCAHEVDSPRQLQTEPLRFSLADPVLQFATLADKAMGDPSRVGVITRYLALRIDRVRVGAG